MKWYNLKGMYVRTSHWVLGEKKTIIWSDTVNSYLFEEGSGEVSSFDSHISQHPLLIGFL